MNSLASDSLVACRQRRCHCRRRGRRRRRCRRRLRCCRRRHCCWLPTTLYDLWVSKWMNECRVSVQHRNTYTRLTHRPVESVIVYEYVYTNNNRIQTKNVLLTHSLTHSLAPTALSLSLFHAHRLLCERFIVNCNRNLISVKLKQVSGWARNCCVCLHLYIHIYSIYIIQIYILFFDTFLYQFFFEIRFLRYKFLSLVCFF